MGRSWRYDDQAYGSCGGARRRDSAPHSGRGDYGFGFPGRAFPSISDLHVDVHWIRLRINRSVLVSEE